jgi:hypothetical protein
LHLLQFHRSPATDLPLAQRDRESGRPRRSDGL